MHFRKVLTLRGPNVWASFPVLEAWVDLGELKDTSSEMMPGFNDRLMSWLPSLIEHRCSVGERGGFFERLRRGTYLAHILEHVTLELQSLSGTAVGYGKARETSEEGVYRVAIQYKEERFAKACLETGRELCLAAVHDRPFDVAAEIARLRRVYEECRLDDGSAAIIDAAKARQIPARRLSGGNIVQLGHAHKQRRVISSETDRTSAIAQSVSRDRQLTRTLLKSVGVPTPEGVCVATAAEAWEAAEDLGLPVIIKPQYASRGRGETGNLGSREAIEAAFDAAAKEDSSVIVERSPTGDHYRLLVVAGKFIAAVRLEPVAGQSRPRSIDVTDLVSEETAEQAVDAAGIVGLDVAGVDIIAQDIAQPLTAQNGAVVEVHSGPDLRFHLLPSEGSPRPVAEAIVGSLFAAGQTGRIPIVGITGVNGKTTTTRLIAHIVGMTGRKVGMTCTDGIFIAGRRIDVEDCSGPQSAGAVLRNPQVEAAVLETARGGILREGLAFDYCDVAVVTNIGEGDHLGLADIDTPEKLAVVKRCLIEAVGKNGTGVLKADDPLTAAMAPYCPGSVVFFCRQPDHPVILAKRAEGGRVVFVRDNSIVLADGELEIRLLSLDRIPMTHGGKIGFQVENALAATAATWSLGIAGELIRTGLETFSASMEKAPGRFNLLEIGGVTVVADYGHNPSALQALMEAFDQFPHAKRTVVYSAAGDRRDCDMIRQGEILGHAFDRVILYEDHYLRGRAPGQISALFKQGMSLGRRVREMHAVQGWQAAVEVALQTVRPGELLLIQADVIDETMEFLRRHLVTDASSREIDLKDVLHVSAHAEVVLTK